MPASRHTSTALLLRSARASRHLTILLGVCLVLACEGSGPSEEPPQTLNRIVAGFGSTCALTSQGLAYCWGGSIEDAEIIDPTCATVPCFRTRPDTLGLGLRFRELRLAPNLFGDVVCGIGTNARTYCWGFLLVGFDGGLQVAPALHPFTPVPVLQTIQVASRHFCGLTLAGEAYCWGDYRAGVRGTGQALADQSVAADLMPNRVAGGLTFTKLALGLSNSCGLDPSGAAYCWGSWVALGSAGAPLSSLEQCGFSVPPIYGPCSHVPVPVTGGHVFIELVAGQSHVCGVTDTGQVYCWGSNEDGELGSGDTVYAATPIQVSLPEPAQTVALGWRFSCALATSGQAYCWGASDFGQVGSGTTAPAVLSPAAVAGGHAYRSIAVGYSHACGLRLSGEVDCWGDNYQGQLGTGTHQNSAVPLQVQF